jgi:nitronate monooxygenase
MPITSPLARAEAFAAGLGIRVPILLAPMAGASPPALSIAVANAGGMGACGALLMEPRAIRAWADEFRLHSQGAFQLNLWIPGPEARRDPDAEGRVRAFLATLGPPVPEGEGTRADFEAQCEAMLDARPRVISSIMGLFGAPFVERMKAVGILWFATASTVDEARAAAAAGADAIVAQGMEAGGHRGSFHSEDAEDQTVGLFALLPQIVDAVSIPVIAAGGIADGRGVAAALILGASAVMAGTAFLRSPEAQVHPAYAQRLSRTEAHDTRLTRAFTGRAGRAIRTRYVDAWAAPDAPCPAPYPLQRAFTRPMRDEAARAGDAERLQMWCGQAARLGPSLPAAGLTERLWTDALPFLR